MVFTRVMRPNRRAILGSVRAECGPSAPVPHGRCCLPRGCQPLRRKGPRCGRFHGIEVRAHPGDRALVHRTPCLHGRGMTHADTRQEPARVRLDQCPCPIRHGHRVAGVDARDAGRYHHPLRASEQDRGVRERLLGADALRDSRRPVPGRSVRVEGGPLHLCRLGMEGEAPYAHAPQRRTQCSLSLTHACAALGSSGREPPCPSREPSARARAHAVGASRAICFPSCRPCRTRAPELSQVHVDSGSARSSLYQIGGE